MRVLMQPNRHFVLHYKINVLTTIKFSFIIVTDLSREVIEKNVFEKTQEPLGRTYQYVYGISLYYHLKLAEKLSNEAKKKYIADSCKKIFTPKEIIQVCII
jgi:hypothetical protein